MESIEEYLRRLIALMEAGWLKLPVGEQFQSSQPIPIPIKQLEYIGGKSNDIKVRVYTVPQEAVEFIFRQKRNVILMTGPPGAGKTSATKWIAKQFAEKSLTNKENARILPVWVDLSDYFYAKSFKQILERELDNIPQSYVGKILWIFDGLDIFFDSSSRSNNNRISSKHFIGDMYTRANNFGDKILVSGRPTTEVIGSFEPNASVIRLEMQPLTPTLCKKWVLQHSPESWPLFCDLCQKHPNLNNFMHIPLLFTMALSVAIAQNDEGYAIPFDTSRYSGIAGIYQGFIQYVLKRREASYIKRYRADVVSKVFYNAAIRGSIDGFHLDWIYDFLNENNCEQQIPAWEESMHILEDAGLIEFRDDYLKPFHQQFAEYWAALHLAHRFEDANKNDFLEAEFWDHFCLTSLDSITGQALSICKDNVSFKVLRRLVGNSWMNEIPEIAFCIGNPKATPILEEALSTFTRNSSEYLSSVLIMGKLGNHAIIEHLENILNTQHNDINIKSTVIEILANYTCQESRAPLLALIKSSHCPFSEKKICVEAICKIGDNAGLEALLKLILDDSITADLRGTITRSLIIYGLDENARSLNIMATSPDVPLKFRKTISENLDMLSRAGLSANPNMAKPIPGNTEVSLSFDDNGNKSHLYDLAKLVIYLYDEIPALEMRACDYWTQDYLLERDRIIELGIGDDVENLSWLLESMVYYDLGLWSCAENFLEFKVSEFEEYDIHDFIVSAIYVLGKLRYDKAISFLKLVITDYYLGDSNIIWAASDALVDIGTKESIMTLKNIYQDDTYSIDSQYAAQSACVKLISPNQICCLSSEWKNSGIVSHELFESVTELSNIGSIAMITPLATILKELEKTQDWPSNIESEFKEERQRSCSSLLMKIIEDCSVCDKIRIPAIYLFMNTCPEIAVPYIAGLHKCLYSDRDYGSVFYATVEALVMSTSSKSTAILLDLIQDCSLHEEYRLSAADRLVELRRPESIPHLAGILASSYSGSLEFKLAMQIFLEICLEDSMPMLIELLKNHELEFECHRAAAVILAKSGASAAINALVTLLEDKTLKEDIKRIIADALTEISENSKLKIDTENYAIKFKWSKEISLACGRRLIPPIKNEDIEQQRAVRQEYWNSQGVKAMAKYEFHNSQVSFGGVFGDMKQVIYKSNNEPQGVDKILDQLKAELETASNNGQAVEAQEVAELTKGFIDQATAMERNSSVFAAIKAGLIKAAAGVTLCANVSTLVTNLLNLYS